jgi:hypothetical protein
VARWHAVLGQALRVPEVGRRFAAAALDRPPAAGEGARGVAAVLRELGQDQAAWDRLRRDLDRVPSDPAAIRLFAELSALPARAPLALPLLERLRHEAPLAAEAWMRLALAADRGAAVAAFLRGGGVATTGALLEALEFAAAQREPELAEAAALALRGRIALPDGWSREEILVTAALARPLTPATLTAALDLLRWAAEAAARGRVVLLLAATPEIFAAAAALDGVASHPAIARLRAEAEAGEGEAATARLALVAVLAPREALGALARRATDAPARFGPALVLALLRSEGVAAGEAALRDLLPRLPRAAQEQALFLLLASGPAAARPMLDGIAEATLGPGWRRSYEAALERSGRRLELLAALRARAAAPGTTAEERREIAARLTQLGDREAAAAR